MDNQEKDLDNLLEMSSEAKKALERYNLSKKNREKNFIGIIGDRLELTIQIIDKKPCKTNSHLFYRGDCNNKLIRFFYLKDLQLHVPYQIVANVKDHSYYKGIAYTGLDKVILKT